MAQMSADKQIWREKEGFDDHGRDRNPPTRLLSNDAGGLKGLRYRPGRWWDGSRNLKEGERGMRSATNVSLVINCQSSSICISHLDFSLISLQEAQRSV
jgi:hypothetical protein